MVAVWIIGSFAAAEACRPYPVVTVGGPAYESREIASSECETNGTRCGSVALSLFHLRSIVEMYGGQYPLCAESLQRSLVNTGTRLRTFLHKVERGDKADVIVVGGSVANGFSAHGTPSSKAFVEWLKSRYPRSDVRFKSLAVDGTDSFWFVANKLETITEADLVILDYSTNDLLTSPDVRRGEMRAVVEKIVRRITLLKSQPAVMVLSLLRSIDATSAATFTFQRQVYEPVARAYGATLVSYRDAVWPDFERGILSHALYETNKGSHPWWYVHQLIADTMAYACEVALALDDVQEESGRIPDSPLFGEPTVDALEACAEPLTSLYHTADPRHSLRLAARFQSPSWTYLAHRANKEGWQFNATATTTAAARRLAVNSKKKDHCRSVVNLPSAYETITFPMNFSANPALVVTYLRSYEHFGPAAVFIDDTKDKVLNMLGVQATYRGVCDRITNKGAKLSKLAHLRYAKSCFQHLAGGLPDPWLLDGHWPDRSSMAFVHAFTAGFAVRCDTNLTPKPNNNKNKNPAPPFVAVADAATPVVATPGVHNVSIALLKHGVLSRFKIMALKSC